MNELIHAYNNMDREKYPDRFKAIVGEIEKRNIKQPEQKKEIKTELQIKQDRLQAVIIWIQRLYLLLALIFTPLCILVLIKAGLTTAFWHGLLSVLIYITIYFGLRQRRSWVIHLVLIVSAIGIFGKFLNIIHPVATSLELTIKLFDVLLFIFYLYQLTFFSKREVKNIFGEKGKTIF